MGIGTIIFEADILLVFEAGEFEVIDVEVVVLQFSAVAADLMCPNLSSLLI